jgi:ABC-type multidrug transport system ATPase subunit
MNGSERPAARPVVVDGPADSILEARDVVLSFGETPALRNANLSVERGEILALVGPSGSGKSTLLHCLAGILAPDSGEILFDGAVWTRWARRSGAGCAESASASRSSSASSFPS